MDKKILLHICCAPCLIFPLEELKKEGYEIKGFFYNPNIQPSNEFMLRRDTLIKYSKEQNLSIDLGAYKPEDFLKKVLDDLEHRCYYCYKMRLEASAMMAKKIGAKIFTTTLLYSKRQKHDLIIKIADNIARKEKLSFLYKDFRVGWKYGIEKSKSLGLYRQNYCGCIFSEKERFYKDEPELL